MKKFIILITVMSFIIVGCSAFKNGENRKCENVLKNFQKVCNELDEKQMQEFICPVEYIESEYIDCTFLNKKISELLNDFLDMFFLSFRICTDKDKQEMLRTLDIDILDSGVSILGDSAKVKCIFRFEKKGEKQEKKVNVKMKKIEDNWYIEGIE